MPSRVEAAVQARAATQEATVQGSRQLGQFLQDHPTSANVGRDGMRQFAMLQAARDKQIADRLQAVEATFDAQLQRQQRLASWLSVLSPTMVAQGVLLEAAGTSASRFDHFRAEARAFQQQWKAYFEPRVLDAATLTADGARQPLRCFATLMRRRRAHGEAHRIADRRDGASPALLLLFAGLARLSRIRVVIEARAIEQDVRRHRSPSTRSISRSNQAKCSACWVPTAPARRRRSTCS